MFQDDQANNSVSDYYRGPMIEDDIYFQFAITENDFGSVVMILEKMKAQHYHSGIGDNSGVHIEFRTFIKKYKFHEFIDELSRTRLRFLRIDKSSQLEYIWACFSKLTSLRFLSLANFNFTRTPTFISLLGKNLTALDMSGNSLERAKDTHYTSSVSVSSVLKQLVNLEFLNISNCNIFFLPETIHTLKKLSNLVLSDNRISLPDEKLAGLNLKYIDANNAINTFGGRFPFNTQSLVGIRIGANSKATHINPQYFSKFIDYVKVTFYGHYPNLQYVEITGDNLLAQVFSEYFNTHAKRFPKLQYVQIENIGRVKSKFVVISNISQDDPRSQSDHESDFANEFNIDNFSAMSYC